MRHYYAGHHYTVHNCIGHDLAGQHIRDVCAEGYEDLKLEWGRYLFLATSSERADGERRGPVRMRVRHRKGLGEASL